MEPELKGLMQIGIIVRDLDKAVKNYETMGIGPWDIGGMDNSKPPFSDLTFNGKEIPEKGMVIRTAMTIHYGLEIELIQPVAKGTPFMKSLEKHGPGLHHLAFNIDGEYKDFIDDKKLWIRAKGVNRNMDFSYADLREQMGIIIECYSQLQSGKPILDYNVKTNLTD